VNREHGTQGSFDMQIAEVVPLVQEVEWAVFVFFFSDK
jgi:hypothetical protein